MYCTVHVYDYIVGVAMSQWGSSQSILVVVKAVATARRVFNYISLVPRLLPDFISQPWRKLGEGLVHGHVVIIMKLSPHYVLTESTISGP